jgi:hypothetical protein
LRADAETRYDFRLVCKQALLQRSFSQLFSASRPIFLLRSRIRCLDSSTSGLYFSGTSRSHLLKATRRVSRLFFMPSSVSLSSNARSEHSSYSILPFTGSYQTASPRETTRLHLSHEPANFVMIRLMSPIVPSRVRL